MLAVGPIPPDVAKNRSEKDPYSLLSHIDCTLFFLLLNFLVELPEGSILVTACRS